MAKFKGTHLNQVQPMLREEYEAVDEMTAEKWWDALSDGVRKDKDLQVDLNDGRNLYYYTDEGTLVRAVEEGKSIQSYGVHMNLLQKSLNGRLFTRSADGKTLRQVVTNPRRGFEVGVSNESDEWKLPNPDPVKPSAPAFWKYLFYPFSSSIREEFRLYQRALIHYPDMIKQSQWIKDFGRDADKDNLLSKDLEEDKRVAEEEKRKQIEKEERAKRLKKELEEQKLREKEERINRGKENYRKEHNKHKERWNLDVSKMTPEEFKKYRANLTSGIDDDVAYQAIIESPYSSLDDLYDYVARNMEALLYSNQYSKDLIAGRSDLMQALSKGNINGVGYDATEDFFTVQQEPWQKMKEALPGLARKYVSQSTVEGFLKSHDWRDTTWKLAMSDEIQRACDKAIPAIKEMGVAFDPKDITPDMAKKMMQVKLQREGAKKLQEFADRVKAQTAQKDAPQQPAPQAQVQNDAPKKEQSKGGHTM